MALEYRISRKKYTLVITLDSKVFLWWHMCRQNPTWWHTSFVYKTGNLSFYL